MIDLKNVSFAYDKEQTLSDLSLHVNKGEFVAIIGSNGAGKSTLSRLLNGLLKPDSGSVLVKGMDTKQTKSSTLARYIGFLFQNPDRQICKNTVAEEIRFGLDLVIKDKDRVQQRLEKTLTLFNLPGEANPFHLSRGERQLVALSSLIAVEPEILILDEPTTGLDYVECMKIMTMIREMNHKGITIIMISHDMEVVLDFAQRVLVLADGRLIADGPVKDIFRKENILEKASLLPPQIASLASRLGGGYDSVFTVDEMGCAITKKIEERKWEYEGLSGLPTG